MGAAAQEELPRCEAEPEPETEEEEEEQAKLILGEPSAEMAESWFALLRAHPEVAETLEPAAAASCFGCSSCCSGPQDDCDSPSPKEDEEQEQEREKGESFLLEEEKAKAKDGLRAADLPIVLEELEPGWKNPRVAVTRLRDRLVNRRGFAARASKPLSWRFALRVEGRAGRRSLRSADAVLRAMGLSGAANRAELISALDRLMELQGSAEQVPAGVSRVCCCRRGRWFRVAKSTTSSSMMY